MFHPTRKNRDGESFRQGVTEAQLPAFEKAGWLLDKVKAEAPVGIEKAMPVKPSDNDVDTDQQENKNPLPGNKPGRPARV